MRSARSKPKQAWRTKKRNATLNIITCYISWIGLYMIQNDTKIKIYFLYHYVSMLSLPDTILDIVEFPLKAEIGEAKHSVQGALILGIC